MDTQSIQKVIINLCCWSSYDSTLAFSSGTYYSYNGLGDNCPKFKAHAFELRPRPKKPLAAKIMYFLCFPAKNGTQVQFYKMKVEKCLYYASKSPAPALGMPETERKSSMTSIFLGSLRTLFLERGPKQLSGRLRFEVPLECCYNY